MIDNLKLSSMLKPLSNSARIQKTGDRDGGRERRRFEEEMGREGQERKPSDERAMQSKGEVEVPNSGRQEDLEDGGLGLVVDIIV